MKTTAGKSFVCLSMGFVLTLCSAVTASAQMGLPPPPTNRLETGGNYQIMPPPTNMMFKITNNDTNAGAGDDNLVWSNSGRMLAVDRSDPSVPGANKFICLLDVRNLGNIQVLGARSSANTNPLFANITGWTWNDDRVLFGWQPQLGSGTPPPMGKVRLMSCTSGTGAMHVASFLQSDPQGSDPTNHVYSPSVVLDPTLNKERLLFLVSSSTNNDEMKITDISDQPAARINLYTVPFASGDVPNWTNCVRLTDFNVNLSINSAKWCPELGTNYQPICNRLEMLISIPSGPGGENCKIIVFNDVQGVIANPNTAPTNLDDSRLVVVETNLTGNSQVSWTYDGQYVMYGRMVNNPPAPPSSDLYSMRADSSTNTAVKFEVPASITGGQKQWLSISPDGMKAAFTVNKQVYVIPLQFDNIAVTGAVVTNVLTDASYTAVDVSGDAIPSNTTFSIVAPPSVDTNNFNGEFSGYAREFSVSGVSSQFNLLTNAEMTLHFSQSDIPSGASATNLAIYVYNPQGTNAGQTGTWDKLDSVINTNSQTISAEVQHFSIYAIGRASAQAENSPSVPTNVSASKGTYQNKMLVAWSASSNATSYQVWRSTTNASSSATKFATEPTSTTFNDTNAVIGTVYYYWVKAKNTAGTSGFSASDSGWAASVSSGVSADYDGDRKADPAVYDEVTGTWKVRLSVANYYLVTTTVGGLGGQGRASVVADYDGDGKADPAVYLEATGRWVIVLSSTDYTVVVALSQTLGGAGYSGMAADYDGDAKADPGVYQRERGDWKVMLSSSDYYTVELLGLLGGTGYRAVAADYDGDGKADPAIYGESNGVWVFRLSQANYTTIILAQALGGTGYLPVPADYDGDGKADPAVRSETGNEWIIMLSSNDYTPIHLTLSFE